ncbi:MAG: ATP-dependent helicase [Anaerolineales bacterium]|uniref:UvrD-helicase domain-containing protein n=1 Tax=Candidatus Villigracilis vicinus TaxID=3140679 RepID=UPI0031372D62|nr:ATP-dependent helicase [Anaerolineales bacterium]
MTSLSLNQRQIIESPLDSRLFVSGMAGTGKTTAGVERIRFLLDQGVPADSILLLTPQRTLQEPYLELLESPTRMAGGEVTPATIGGLARRMCDLFWSFAAEEAGFARPEQPPIFLTLETAQYYMAHLVRPMIEEQGYFDSVTINRNRLYSQIIDNLNKAAIVGFPHTEIGARLDSAWFGDPAQRRVYADAQECATLFRQYCLDNNLLDFSLQLEIFKNILWQNPQSRSYLTQTYRHLIYDNVEEDISCAHVIVHDWLPNLDSALLIYDQAAGYRKFLGGDPDSGLGLSGDCDMVIELNESFVSSANVIQLSNALISSITKQEEIDATGTESAMEFIMTHFHPEMLDVLIANIQALIEQGTPPAEIVVLSPYLSDSLRFSIADRLEAAGIPWRSNRPSRSLRDEPASKSLLTLSALAHPHWNVRPPKFDVAHALMFTLNTDLIRAQLLTEIIYGQRDLRLSSFEEINADTQERITYALGARYTTLRNWIEEYRANGSLPLDFFLRRLFGEVVSQPEFGFHSNLDAVRIAASLIESIKKFRNAMDPIKDQSNLDLGMEYITMLQDGVIAAQYLESWRSEDKNAVLVAPAYTFLMMNRPATYQFWLDPGSDGWSQRVIQPLTHPYVLSRYWDASAGRVWLDSDEVEMEIETLTRLTGGLLARCREKIFLTLSDLGAAGFEQRGVLLRAFQKVLINQTPASE